MDCSDGREMKQSEKVLIQVQNLFVSYGDVPVLKDINFEINEGEFVSIVGTSGCGKSTLLYALAGFIESRGHIQMPSELGVVFQNYAVFPWMTVAGNIAFGLHRLPAEKRDKIVQHHLSLIGLEQHADKYPGQLSGGQTQRVALARALAPNPQVIFMDEPFGALDMFTRDKMQNWLEQVWENDNKTVLFVTHNIEEAIYLSDRIMILNNESGLMNIDVPFARPRLKEMKFSQEFVQLKRKILEQLEVD